MLFCSLHISHKTKRKVSILTKWCDGKTVTYKVSSIEAKHATINACTGVLLQYMYIACFCFNTRILPLFASINVALINVYCSFCLHTRILPLFASINVYCLLLALILVHVASIHIYCLFLLPQYTYIAFFLKLVFSFPCLLPLAERE